MKQNDKDVSIKIGLCVFCTGGGQKHNVGSWKHDVVARNYFLLQCLQCDTATDYCNSTELVLVRWAQEVRVPP